MLAAIVGRLASEEIIDDKASSAFAHAGPIDSSRQSPSQIHPISPAANQVRVFINICS